MAVDVEEQEPKVSTENLADKISIKDDPKQEEAEEELQVCSSEPSSEKTEKPEPVVSSSGAKPEAETPVAKEEASVLQESTNQDASTSKKTRASPFSFISRIFRGSGPRRETTDVEAGTELLSKGGEVTSTPSQEELTPADKVEEVKGDEDTTSNKKEKGSPESDVTVQVVPDEKDGKSNGEASQKMFTSRFNNVRWRWILSGFLLFFIIFIVAGFLAAQLAYLPPEEGHGDNALPLAVTSCGPVLGVKEEGVFVFRGVPYALPPTKDRRWKPPFVPSKLEDCWQGTLLAQNLSRRCMQHPLEGQELSEDCLTLNVITPNLSYQKSLPVVVYMSGSSLLGLDERDLSWQPSPPLAKEQGVVFVTFNYRLGLFGFMSLDVLGKAVYPPTSGNYGFHDQVAVLKWVAKNIRHFGGDPDKVTLLAHGSGATSALALVGSKKTKGLFSQAWLTGGSALFTDKALTEVQMDNTDFLKNTGCESVSCLHQKSAQELMEALPERWGRPTPMDLPVGDEEPVPAVAVIDGWSAILYDQPMNVWKEGDLNGVKVVMGATAQESSLWPTDKSLSEWGWTELTSYIRERLDTINATLAPQVLDFYVDNNSTPEAQFHTMVSDIRVVCPLQDLVSQLPDSSQSQAYFYVLTYKPSATLNGSAPLSSHGLDLLAILGLLDLHVPEMGPLDLVYQSNMQDLFYSFVKNGKPTNGDTELQGAGQVNLVSASVTSAFAPYKNCKVWEELRTHRFGRMN